MRKQTKNTKSFMNVPTSFTGTRFWDHIGPSLAI